MLNLFFVLVTSEKKDYDELKECSETIQPSLYTRCLIPQGGTTFDSKQELYIYLHSNSEANLSFTLLDTPTTVLPQLPRGKGIHFSDTNVKAKCESAKGCFATIWYSDYGKKDSFFASDAAGAIYNYDKELPNRYVMLFDFGSECRISVKKLYHSRENGLIFQYYDKTAIQTLKLHI